MSTTSKSHFLWSIPLTFTIIICITIICLSISRSAEKQKFSSRSKKQGSLQPEKLTGGNCIPTCDSKECVTHAKNILSYLDSNVDPCDNAYLFTCGKYEKNFAPDDFDLKGSTEEKLFIELRDILDNIQAEPGSPSWKLKNAYDSCMNISSSELQGSIHFQTFLKNKFGITNWPNLDSDFRFPDSRISKLLGHVRSFQEFRVFDIEKEEGKNYTYSVIFPGYFVTKEDFSLKGALHALDYFDLSQEDIEIILSDYEDVKNSIAELYSNLSNYNTTPVYVNCSNLTDEEWMLVCEIMEIYHNEVTKFGEEGRRDVIVIKVADPILVKNVLPLMDSLPDRSVANYFALKFLWKYLEEINFYFRLTKMKFESREEDRPRLPFQKIKADLFEHCMKWITTMMKLSLAKELFRHYLTTRIMDEISGLYTESKADLIKIMDLQEWIPPERKSRIVTRVGNLPLNIEIIKNLVENNTFLDDHYKLFHPTTESFFDNEMQYQKINIIRSQQRSNLDYKTEIVMEDKFEVYASTFIETIEMLSESHNLTDRERVLLISLNYGMFFPNYYAPNLRRDVNRFTLGLTLGHEIGHNIAFLLGTPFWNHTDVPPEFLELKHCIDNQFSAFKFDMLKENLNGSTYSDENLADYFGIVLLEKILDEYDSAPQNQFLLPGLAYSTKQLLYISAVQTTCSKDNLVSEKSYQVDEHAPWKFRTIVASQNSRSYSRLFQCSDRSFMNPKKKCSLLSSS